MTVKQNKLNTEMDQDVIMKHFDYPYGKGNVNFDLERWLGELALKNRQNQDGDLRTELL